jgi:RimJ/RimL family protein N-acetyltransferase
MIQTPRLTLRELTPDDAPFMLELLNSPGWLTYIGDRNVHNVADAKKYLEERTIPSYQKHNFGFYAVELRDAQVVIGTCGIAQRDFLHDPDIGFAFLPEYNGQGYALEAAQAVMEFAQQDLGIQRILAFTLPINKPSIRLLEKIGLRSTGTIQIPDDPEELLLFAVDLPF